jgi:hypothetical protein
VLLLINSDTLSLFLQSKLEPYKLIYLFFRKKQSLTFLTFLLFRTVT